MVSAKGQEQDIATALNSGALSYLVKPWEPDDLEAKVLQAEAALRIAASALSDIRKGAPTGAPLVIPSLDPY